MPPASRLAAPATSSSDRVCVVGAGYVGLVTATCLADAGHRVVLVEVDRQRLESLQQGRAPIYEPGLEELLGATLAAGRLEVSDDLVAAAREDCVVLVTVGTPEDDSGAADLSQVRSVVAAAADTAHHDAVLCIKSTVPPGTTHALSRTVVRGRRPLVVCPEFLRQGTALDDFRHPARVVVGGDDAAAVERVCRLFAHLDVPILRMDATSAELVKYGSNAFLALKISFINEIAQLCEHTGADVALVAEGMGLDPRVGRSFLAAGLGFGGSCFPKDVRALEAAAAYHGQSMWMLKAAIEVNQQQRRRFVRSIREAAGGQLDGRRIAALGLAFKPGTDDLRQAPSVDIVRQLQDFGAQVVATDPVATVAARPLLPDTELVEDPYRCVADADAVVLITEWPEYVGLNWARVATLVRHRVVVDGRNCLDPQLLVRLGFSYRGVGRRPVTPD